MIISNSLQGLAVSVHKSSGFYDTCILNFKMNDHSPKAEGNCSHIFKGGIYKKY